MDKDSIKQAFDALNVKYLQALQELQHAQTLLKNTKTREVVVPMATEQELLYRDQIKKLKEHNQDLITQLQNKPQIIEKESSKDLKRAAKIMASSELNKEDLSEQEIFELLEKSNEDIVNKQLGFWAVPLPTNDDTENKPRYYKK